MQIYNRCIYKECLLIFKDFIIKKKFTAKSREIQKVLATRVSGCFLHKAPSQIVITKSIGVIGVLRFVKSSFETPYKIGLDQVNHIDSQYFFHDKARIKVVDRSKDEIPSAIDKEEFAEMFIQKEDFQLFHNYYLTLKIKITYCFNDFFKRARTLSDRFIFFKEKLDPSSEQNNGNTQNSNIRTNRNHSRLFFKVIPSLQNNQYTSWGEE